MNIIDIHAHLSSYPEGDANALLRIMDNYGVSKACISNVEGGYYPTPDAIRYDNDTVAKAIAEHPDRFMGAVYINPANPDTMDVLRRGFEEQGMSLVKVWVAVPDDDRLMDPVMEYTESIGVPVLFHTLLKVQRVIPTESTGINIKRLAKRHPKSKIIMAHFGGTPYDGLPAIRDCENVWCDYALSIFTGDAMNYAREMLGADRLLYGSDMAGVSVPVCIGKVLGADFTDEERELVFHKNAERLLDRSFRL